MKRRPSCLVLIGLIFLWPLTAYAHGVTGTVDRGGLVVTARYDSGEPMSYARVTILSPDAEVNFQSGRTDKNGRFCFFPDTAGAWEVVVDDEIGHRLEVDVPIDKQLVWKEVRGSAEARGMMFSQYKKMILGVLMVLGLFSILFWGKSRKK